MKTIIKEINLYLSNAILNKKYKTWFHGILLGALFVIILSQLSTLFPESSIANSIKKKYYFIENYIFILAVLSGSCSFYVSRKKIETDLEKGEEDIEEQRRKKEFPRKFLKINKIPILKNIIRFMFKEGWQYSLLLIAVVLVGIFLRISYLGNLDFWTDEVFSFHAAKMIIEKGKPIYDSQLYYDRAIIYHHITAISMRIFGINEFGSRLPNILFSSGTIILIYYILKVYSKKFALMGSLLFAFCNISIAMAQHTRMYDMLCFFFLLSAYSFYNAFENTNKKLNILRLNCSFNFKWFIIFIISFYISYNTHAFSVFLLIGFLVYYIIISIREFNKENALIIIGLFSAFLMGLLYKFNSINIKEIFFVNVVPEWALRAAANLNINYYKNYLNNNYINEHLYLIFVLFFLVIYFLNPSKINRLPVLLSSVTILIYYYLSYSPLHQLRYVYFLIPFFILSITIGFFYIKILFKEKLSNMVFCSMVLFSFPIIFGGIEEFYRVKNYESMFYHKGDNPKETINYVKNKFGRSILVADWHSAFTSTVYGRKPDYILVLPNSEKLRREKDVYFNIPFIVYNSDEYKHLIEYNNVVFMIKSPLKFRFKNIIKTGANKKPPFVYFYKKH